MVEPYRRNEMKNAILEEISMNWENMAAMEENAKPGRSETLRECADLLRMATDNPLFSERETGLEELVRSACAIADRKGAGTAWGRFVASACSFGLNGVTARTYRILPSDIEGGSEPVATVAATLPAAPAPTGLTLTKDQMHAIAKVIAGRVAKNAGVAPELRFAPVLFALQDAFVEASALPAEQAALPNDFLMPEDAWDEYATRSGLLNEHGVAPHPATAQAAYFAYQAAWNCLHKAFSAYIAARPAPTVPKLDYDLLKLMLEQAQERLRQAEDAIAKRDATALRVAQCAGEFARDAARFATAIALEDNAETLYSVVMSHAPDTDAIRRAFDAVIAQEKAQ
jgi:hypothetical protein